MAASTTVIDTVARRLRDLNNFAYPRPNLVRLIDHAQRMLNAHFKFITVTLPLQTYVTTVSIQRIRTCVGTNVASIEAVRVSGRSLDRVPYRTLIHQNPRWLIATGTRPIYWSTIGKDLLVIAPIVRTLALADFEVVTVPAIPSTILDDGSADIAIPDEAMTMLTDLVETLALFSGRRFPEAGEVVERVQNTLDAFNRQHDIRLALESPL